MRCTPVRRPRSNRDREGVGGSRVRARPRQVRINQTHVLYRTGKLFFFPSPSRGVLAPPGIFFPVSSHHDRPARRAAELV